MCDRKVVEWNDPAFEGWLKKMGNKRVEGQRAVILLDVWKVRLVPLVRSLFIPLFLL